MSQYPQVKDQKLVGSYPAIAKAGGGYVWDSVLEYRVWCHPLEEEQKIEDRSDYYYAFKTYEEALAFSKDTPMLQKSEDFRAKAPRVPP